MHTTSNLDPTVSCQQQHQNMNQIIQQQADEIAQLRTILLQVTEQYNCRSLRHDAIDYCRDLTHLQTKLTRLHRDMICTADHCPPAQTKQLCSDAHFGLSATLDRHTTVLAGEFSRIKDGCLQFLGGMMSLNLL